MTELDKAVIKAYRYLARSARSENEVKSYLADKGFDRKVVRQVIGKLKKLGFVDDRKFTCDYVEREKNKNTGILKMKTELEYKGVEEKITNKTLKKFSVTERSQQRTAEKLFKMKIKQYCNKPTDKILRKAAYYLARQGFEEQIIEEILEKYKADFVI